MISSHRLIGLGEPFGIGVLCTVVDDNDAEIRHLADSHQSQGNMPAAHRPEAPARGRGVSTSAIRKQLGKA